MLKLKKEFLKARVQLEMPCPECGGTGMVMNALWSQYWTETSGNENYVDWFMRKKMVRHNEIPDEYEACPECGGTKVVEGVVKLEDLFDEMTLTEAVIDVAVTMNDWGGA